VSAVSAFRFSGSAVAPLVWLPIYYVHPTAAFVAAGSSLLIAVVALLALRPAASVSRAGGPR
jgi:hypothetical protein